MNFHPFKLYHLLILTILIFTNGCNDSKEVKDLNNFMDYCSENGMFNGAIYVTENDKIIFSKAYGFANLSTKEMLTTSHAFYLASVSKQFTTMAIMMLKEAKNLEYEKTLFEYFPEFPRYAKKVTIKHLMTHTSGIPDHFNLGAYKPGLTNNDVLQLLIKQDSLDFEPGEKFSYSNGGYVLLALIVEKASGQPFHIFMKENIFDPLKMNSTLVYDESKPNIPKRAIGYNSFGEIDDYNIFTTGAGGIYSTVEDLQKWNIALIENMLVTQESLNEAYTPLKFDKDDLSGYGFGWSIKNNSLEKIVSHSGGLAGFRTYIERNLTNKKSFFFLTNFGNSVPLGKINEGIRNILENKNFTFPKISISIKLKKIINTDGIKTAVEYYRKVKTDQDQKYNFQEEELNFLGYNLLEGKKILDAIEVFKLNIEAFPESSNTYDSMGEAYMVNKDFDLATINYKKSLEINSENNNAVLMLKKIEELNK